MTEKEKEQLNPLYVDFIEEKDFKKAFFKYRKWIEDATGSKLEGMNPMAQADDWVKWTLKNTPTLPLIKN